MRALNHHSIPGNHFQGPIAIKIAIAHQLTIRTFQEWRTFCFQQQTHPKEYIYQKQMKFESRQDELRHLRPISHKRISIITFILFYNITLELLNPDKCENNREKSQFQSIQISQADKKVITRPQSVPRRKGTLSGHPFQYSYNILSPQSLTMTSNQQYGRLSLKYIAASFFATYFAGVVHPFDLIKTRFQSHDGKGHDNLVPKYSGINNALKSIYKSEGLRGLYKGFYISLLCQATSMSVFFWHYQTRKIKFERAGYETMNAVTRASVEASILCTLITQPIWVIKTRMLLNTHSRISEYQNFKRQCREIYAHDGLKGALRGLELSLLLSLSGVIQMYVYEGSKLLYDRLRLPESSLGEKHFVCGALSKIFSIFLSYPITTLRTRIQQNQFTNCSSSRKYKSLRDLAGKTWREEGVRGLYKGMNANLIKGVSQKGIYFYFYEIFKDYLFPHLQPSKAY